MPGSRGIGCRNEDARVTECKEKQVEGYGRWVCKGKIKHAGRFLWGSAGMSSIGEALEGFTPLETVELQKRPSLASTQKRVIGRWHRVARYH
jgi:hypothetical protein